MTHPQDILLRYLAAPGAWPPQQLRKATGEGSRGGKILGHTRSGKPIYAKHADRKAVAGQFTSRDHHDAYDWHDHMNSLHSSAAEKALDSTDSEFISPTLRNHLMLRHDHLKALAQRHHKISEWYYKQHQAASKAEDKADEEAYEEMERRHARAG